MADIDLDLIVAQREEARANGEVTTFTFDYEDVEDVKTEGDTFTFKFAGQDWVIRDPQFLSDDEKDRLAPITFDADVTAWYMGETQYDRFIEAGGESWMFFKAFTEYQKKVRDEAQGNPTRPNRSSRRAQRRSKRH